MNKMIEKQNHINLSTTRMMSQCVLNTEIHYIIEYYIYFLSKISLDYLKLYL